MIRAFRINIDVRLMPTRTDKFVRTGIEKCVENSAYGIVTINTILVVDRNCAFLGNRRSIISNPATHPRESAKTPTAVFYGLRERSYELKISLIPSSLSLRDASAELRRRISIILEFFDASTATLILLDSPRDAQRERRESRRQIEKDVPTR